MNIDIQAVLLEIFEPSFLETVRDEVVVKHFFEMHLAVELIDDDLGVKLGIYQQKVDFSLDGCHFELDDLSSLDGYALR